MLNVRSFYMSTKKKKKNPIVHFVVKLVVLLILIGIIFYLSFTIFFDFARKRSLEETTLPFVAYNENTIFSIDKILLFSSASASNVTAKANGSWVLDVNQYTDIAIYLDTGNFSTFTDENTIKSLTIDQVKLGNPKQGTPHLFYKDMNTFATFVPEPEENVLTSENSLEYTILPSTGSIDYTKPQIYQTANNPITLGYVNTLQTEAVITDTSTPLVHDGSLLKKASIPISSIANTISFRITIINNLNQRFSTIVSLEIPVYDEGVGDYGNLYNGSIVKHLASETYLYRLYRFQ